MWKDFFYHSKYEKQGIIILLILLLLCFGIRIYLSNRTVNEEFSNNERFKAEYGEFMASLNEIKPVEKKVRATRTNNHTKRYIPKAEQKDNFSYCFKASPNKKTEDSTEGILPNYAKREKYPFGTTICLNSADTAELMKIPGIGPARASMIVNFRKQLGGFFSTGQLMEIKKLDSVADTLINWFCLTDSTINPINLNTAPIERLKAHPYINFYQAKVIVEYRKKKGKIKNIDQLKLYEEFNENDLERIKPYVCF